MLMIYQVSSKPPFFRYTLLTFAAVSCFKNGPIFAFQIKCIFKLGNCTCPIASRLKIHHRQPFHLRRFLWGGSQFCYFYLSAFIDQNNTFEISMIHLVAHVFKFSKRISWVIYFVELKPEKEIFIKTIKYCLL